MVSRGFGKQKWTYQVKTQYLISGLAGLHFRASGERVQGKRRCSVSKIIQLAFFKGPSCVPWRSWALWLHSEAGPQLQSLVSHHLMFQEPLWIDEPQESCHKGPRTITHSSLQPQEQGKHTHFENADTKYRHYRILVLVLKGQLTTKSN